MKMFYLSCLRKEGEEDRLFGERTEIHSHNSRNNLYC